MIDGRGCIEAINEAGCLAFGYDRDELIGSNVIRLIPGAFGDRRDRPVHAVDADDLGRVVGIRRRVTGVRHDGSPAPPEPSPFAGDAVSLREAVRNIIENAVHHGARHKAEILLKRTQDAYVVECRDDGPGIAREDWPDAPTRFSRGQSGGNGSGLGLSIASDVAKHHGGALDFDFCDNGDFLVRLTLPANGGSAP